MPTPNRFRPLPALFLLVLCCLTPLSVNANHGLSGLSAIFEIIVVFIFTIGLSFILLLTHALIRHLGSFFPTLIYSVIYVFITCKVDLLNQTSAYMLIAPLLILVALTFLPLRKMPAHDGPFWGYGIASGLLVFTLHSILCGFMIDNNNLVFIGIILILPITALVYFLFSLSNRKRNPSNALVIVWIMGSTTLLFFLIAAFIEYNESSVYRNANRMANEYFDLQAAMDGEMGYDPIYPSYSRLWLMFLISGLIQLPLLLFIADRMRRSGFWRYTAPAENMVKDEVPAVNPVQPVIDPKPMITARTQKRKADEQRRRKR
jgi:hypothetical protein